MQDFSVSGSEIIVLVPAIAAFWEPYCFLLCHFKREERAPPSLSAVEGDSSSLRESAIISNISGGKSNAEGISCEDDTSNAGVESLMLWETQSQN